MFWSTILRSRELLISVGSPQVTDQKQLARTAGRATAIGAGSCYAGETSRSADRIPCTLKRNWICQRWTFANDGAGKCDLNRVSIRAR